MRLCTQFESRHALVDLIEYEVFGTLPVSDDVVKDASKRDVAFSRVIDDICNGRKLSRNSSLEDGEIIAFCRREAELTVCGEIFIWRSRVVVPKKLRGRLLNELHAVHSGIVHMKSLAREHFWWPEMDGEIETLLVVVVNVRKMETICKRYLYILGSYQKSLGKDCTLT